MKIKLLQYFILLGIIGIIPTSLIGKDLLGKKSSILDTVKEFKYQGVGLNFYSPEEVKYIKPEQVACLNISKKNEVIKGIVLRGGKYYISLFKFNSNLIKQIDANKVTFSFRPFYIEKQKPYIIRFYRILVPWTISATWTKPADNSVDWNGMKAGYDYSATPFAELKVNSPSKKPQEVEGFLPIIKNWADVKWPNYGFVVMISGKALQINISTETKIKGKK